MGIGARLDAYIRRFTANTNIGHLTARFRETSKPSCASSKRCDHAMNYTKGPVQVYILPVPLVSSHGRLIIHRLTGGGNPRVIGEATDVLHKPRPLD